MRTSRVTLEGEAYYQVLNQVNPRIMQFDEHWSGVFLETLRRVEAFTGVELLTYCVLPDHFHLLVRVPERRAIKDEELLSRYEQSVSPLTFKLFKQQWDYAGEEVGGDGQNALREKLMKRLFDLSDFMHAIKQRFTTVYNTETGQSGWGTIWTNRFSSAPLDGSWKTVTMAATYIDLKAVKYKLVEDPKEYAWCGYAAAANGDVRAKEGLRKILGDQASTFGKSKDVVKLYEKMLKG